MTEIIESKVGKKNTLYLPKEIVRAANLHVGDRILLRVIDNKIIVERIVDPIKQALYGKKYAKLTPEEIEDLSYEEQTRYTSTTP